MELWRKPQWTLKLATKFKTLIHKSFPEGLKPASFVWFLINLLINFQVTDQSFKNRHIPRSSRASVHKNIKAREVLMNRCVSRHFKRIHPH